MGNKKSKEDKINKDLFNFIKVVKDHPDFGTFELYSSIVKQLCFFF